MKAKNLLIITLGIILLAFNSCKKEDNETIIGKWDYNTITASVEPENEIISGVINVMISQGKPDQLSITFNEDNTYTLSIAFDGGAPETTSGTYKTGNGVISFSTLPEMSIMPKIAQELSYSLSKNNLKMTISLTTSEIIDFMIEGLDEEQKQQLVQMLSVIKKVNITIDCSKNK